MVPDSVFIPVEQPQSFWSLNYQWISLIIQGLIACGAIWAATYATRAFSLSRASRRALMAPSDTPGGIEETGKGSRLTINLRNYGNNPAFEGRGSVILYDRKYQVIDSKLKEGFWYNPIAANTEWRLHWGFELGFDLEIMYIRMDVEYMDQALKEKFIEHPFFWKVAENRMLNEPHIKDIDELLKARVKTKNTQDHTA
ncbi:MAG: hypothetical protein FVQ85_20875 [Planctomycetes bacterium]|nr:hypothetical protein [Planctomycetota bacterium]